MLVLTLLLIYLFEAHYHETSCPIQRKIPSALQEDGVPLPQEELFSKPYARRDPPLGCPAITP